MSVRDTLQRRVVPRTIVALSTVDLPARVDARLRRARGAHGRVQLFVAFDDAYSAIALVGLAARLADRPAELVVEAVVARGIPGDPAVEDKRRYAVLDARRLAQRDGLTLTRTDVLRPDDVAFLADWCAAASDDATRTAFAIAAMRELWFGSDGPVQREPYAALWREHVGGEPPTADATDPAASERRMRRRHLYDTPVAVVGGQWFFAHERLAQIEHRLDQLGWKAAA